MKIAALLLPTLLITYTAPAFAVAKPNKNVVSTACNPAASGADLPSQQEVQQIAKKITVRITSEKNGGSGVLIAKKGSTYLVLTNAHVAGRATQFQIQAPDGQKYTAKKIDGGFDAKYDLALLQFSSKTKYTLADLTDVASPLAPERTIYSAGFPFDAKDVRITSGKVSQLSDIPFDDGTQIGYTIDKGKKGIRQGMSGGAILDGRGKFLGINTLSNAPISPSYTYNDGSKPPSELIARYRQANWGVPIYNFLIKVKPDILYGYDNLPKVEHQITPTGYSAELNKKARRMTVRIEAGGENGSGVVIAKEGNSYYVLTAKHVVKPEPTKENPKTEIHNNIETITYDQNRHRVTSTVVAEGVDLAVVKFSSKDNYPLAQLGNYNPNADRLAFVGGFPGREKINSPLWQWQLNPGIISDPERGKIQAQNKFSFSSGYDLLYSNISYGGMSGGPVFDTDGVVIGIHGRAESFDNATCVTSRGEESVEKVILGQSLGISIQTFTGLLAKLQVKPQLLKISKNTPTTLRTSDADSVMKAMKNITQPSETSSGKSWITYGNQLSRTRQYNKSVMAFNKAITRGEVLTGNYGKALALWESNNPKEAEIAISKAISLVPKNRYKNYYYLWKYQSDIFSDLKRYSESLKAIDIAIRLEPGDLIVFSRKAIILMTSKKYKEAISILNIIINKQPGYYAYNMRGFTKVQSKDFQGAIADLNQVIKLNPNAMSYNMRGLARKDSGDSRGAIEDFSQAIKLNPKYAEAYNSRGISKQSVGDSREAIKDFDQALKLDPKYADAYSQRGIAKSQSGDSREAIKDFDQALKLDPKDAKFYNNRGVSKQSVRDSREAIKDFSQALKLNPKYAEAYNNRGVTKSESGDRPGAIADFDQALKLDPKYAEAYSNRGMTKSQSGDKKGAILDFDQAIAIRPQNAIDYNLRGMTKSQLGDQSGAIADLTESAELCRQQGQTNMYRQIMAQIERLKGSKTKN